MENSELSEFSRSWYRVLGVMLNTQKHTPCHILPHYFIRVASVMENQRVGPTHTEVFSLPLLSVPKNNHVKGFLGSILTHYGSLGQFLPLQMLQLILIYSVFLTGRPLGSEMGQFRFRNGNWNRN